MTTLMRQSERSERGVGRRRARWFVDAVLALTAVQFLVLGVWAFGWPHGFHTTVAHFPPFNLHLVHDAGAFQMGIGATMLLGLVWRQDVVLAVLAGGSVAAVTHAISHITDRDLGGRSGDPYWLSALTVLLLVATALRGRASRKAGGRTRNT